MQWKHFVLFAFAVLFCLSTGRTVLAQDEYDPDADYGDDNDDLDAPSGGGGLMLTAGTMQVGGKITFQIDTQRDVGGGGTLFFEPEAGFFIIDHLELLAGIGFMTAFGDANSTKPTDFFFNVGAKYFIPIGTLALYAGGLIGMDFYGFDSIGTGSDGLPTSTRVQQNSMLLRVPVGLLIPLNQHIGLDIGASFDFHIGLGNYDEFLMHIPIGYLGIQGFFKLGG